MKKKAQDSTETIEIEKRYRTTHTRCNGKKGRRQHKIDEINETK